MSEKGRCPEQGWRTENIQDTRSEWRVQVYLNGEGRRGESPSPSLRSRGLIWEAGMCRRQGMDLSLGPSAGLMAPGTQDRVSAPGFTEEPFSECAEEGAL